jgi:hypothetical protein
VLAQAGAATNRNGAWSLGTANTTPYAGHRLRSLIDAADACGASPVKAGVDVRITQPWLGAAESSGSRIRPARASSA